ncbi:MAG: Fe-S cluster assembly protein HesB [Planctomycetota bacterium]
MTSSSRLTLPLPSPFELRLVALSHGWYDLAPFAWDPDRQALAWSFRLGSGNAAHVEVRQRSQTLLARVTATRPLDSRQRSHIKGVIRSCLRLDEDLTTFHAVAEGDTALAWAARRGAGRMLRSPTVFEDLIKVLFTTNCSWALTKVMVTRLISELGEDAPGGGKTFPAPERVAECDEAFLRERIRCGYRAPHVRALAVRVASGDLDPESWRREPRADDDLYRELTALPGIGPYAAGTLQRLLGHYSQAALDSWCRARFQELYGARRAKNDAAILKRYQPFGPWLGLALWLDLTREWHEGETGVPL